MTTRYSKTTGTFYPSDIDYGANLPPDVITVSDADFAAVMSRPLGATFSFDATKKLTITPAPVVVVNPNDAINAQIAAIEAQTIVPRITREEMMRNAERWAAYDATPTNTAAMILAANTGYQRVKAVDDKVRALRAQIV